LLHCDTRLSLHAQEKPGPESILYLHVADIRAAAACDHGAGETLSKW